MAESETRWRAVPLDSLAWREWDDELVVFNRLTGNTHLLEGLGAEVLRRLLASTQATTANRLAADLSQEPGGSVEAGWEGSVANVLSEFARLGLAQADTS